MKYNIIIGEDVYKQLTYSEIILYIRNLILNEESVNFSIELKTSNIIEGIDKFINNNNIKIQTLNFTCNKGQCSFTGLNDISCHWFQNNNIKELQVYSPCSLIFINDIFDNKIYTNIAIKNDDSSITLIDEYIKNFKYDILAKEFLLDFINNNDYKKTEKYEKLKQNEKNKIDKAYKNIVKTISEEIEKMKYAIVHIDDNKSKK